MARKLQTVTQLALAVRARLDEMNRDTIEDNRDILPALNRALEYAVDIYSRYYPDPYLDSVMVPLESGTAEYDLPEAAYEDRVVKIDLLYNNYFYSDIQRIAYKDLVNYETNAVSAIPYYYAIIGRTIKVVPIPSSGYSMRVWYVKSPDQLVFPQGRITVVNETNNYVVVDAVGGNISTESDQLENFINIINARTGEVRGTFQVAATDDTRITLRSSPNRSEVLGQPVLSSIADLGIKEDDYVCLATGTCVPYLSSPTANFLIQYSIAELCRQLGVNGPEEEQVIDKFEKQVKTTWAGREPTARINKRNNIYGRPVRPWPLRQKGPGNG